MPHVRKRLGGRGNDRRLSADRAKICADAKRPRGGELTCSIHRWRALPSLIAFCLASLAGSVASAQRIAQAAVIDHRVAYVMSSHPVRDSTHSLQYHMKRGAIYGTITGAALGVLTALAVAHSRGSCCEQPSTKLTFPHALGIVAVESAVGATVGLVLGYSYYVNREPQK
jgi:hypothetical protein